MLRRTLKAVIRQTRHWLEEDHPLSNAQAPLPFENSYSWLGATFLALVRDPTLYHRQGYLWGVLQGVALAKVLGLSRVSVVEFGVAGGAGLLALEHIAERVERLTEVQVDVYGFDTGCGLPEPQDYRDCPNIWSGGVYAMDKAQLESRLRRAHLKLGLIEETVPAFLKSSFSPVAFISFDVDLYSSTRDALILLEAKPEVLLPRIFCYFDDIIGFTFGDLNGERLAIAEFNETHRIRKLSPIYGLKHFVPAACANSMWVDLFYVAHILDHPLYGQADGLRKPTVIDIDGNLR